MKSANSGTPRSYLEVKGLHRLGDAVVGRRRHPITADALEEAHLRARGSLVDGRRPARVARSRLGQPPRLGAASGGPAVPLSTRARWPRRVWLPGTSSTILRNRCGAGARDGCQPRCCAHLMGRCGESPPPSRSRASRAAGRTPRRDKKALRKDKTRPSVSGANSASPRSTSARGPKSSPAV